MSNNLKIDLSKYDNSNYKPGRSFFICIFWYITNILFFKSSIVWPIGFKCMLLRLFGARIGKNITIKPCVNVKYPWRLTIGNNVWIGENVWIDNLDDIIIQDNVCISQGALLLTGNHNYKKKTFDLITKSIKLEEGCWIGAKSVVCPGITCGTHSVLTVGSVATDSLESYYIYSGNPAIKIKKRILDE